MQIIAAAASGKAYQRKRGISCKYLFPYNLVERGDEGKAIKKRTATREEYVLGLKRMDEEWCFKPLSRHPETVTQDTARYPGRPSDATQRRSLRG